MSRSEPPSSRPGVPTELLARWRELADLTSGSAEDRSGSSAEPLAAKSRRLLETLRALPDADLLSLVRAAASTQMAKERLEESEAKFATAFHESPIPMVISRLEDARLIEVNRAFERISGFSARESIGRTAIEVGLWSDPEERERWVKEMRNHGAVHDVELQFNTRSGGIMICNTTASIVTIGGERHILTAVEDITEQRRIEEDLRRSEDRYRSFVQNFAGIAYQGRDFVPYFFHGDVEGITGYTEQEFLAGNLKWNEIVHPEDRGVFETADERKLHAPGGHAYEREYRIVSKDGRIVWVRDNVQSVCDESGAYLHLQGTIQDITVRKRAEQALRRSEREFRAFFDNSPNFSALLTADGRVMKINKQALALATGGAEEIKDVPFWELPLWSRSDEDRIKARDAVRRAAAGKMSRLEFRVHDGRGKSHLIVGDLCPIIDEHGEIVNLLGIGWDETDSESTKIALRQSEARLRALIQTAAVVIISLSPDHRIIEWNHEAEQLFGYSKEDVLGQDYIEKFVAPSERSQVAMDLQKILRGGQTRDFERAVTTRDGSERILLWNVTSLVDPSGQATEIIAIGHDITKRKEIEHDLERARSLLLAAIEQSPAGILIADAPDVRIRIANAAALGIRGESEHPLVDIDSKLHPRYWQVFHPDGTPFDPTELPLSRAVLEGETVRAAEAIIRRSDGEDRLVLANAAPVKDTSGSIIAGVVVFQDITERKRAEQALRESESKFRAVFDQSIQLTGLLSLDGTVLEVNQAALELAGVEAADVIGKSYLETPWWPDSFEGQETLEAAFRKAKAGEWTHVQATHLDTTGRTRELDAMLGPLISDNGEVIAVIPVGFDITGIKQTEQELMESREALRALASELASAEERERRRIASDLHDRLGQALAVLRMKFGSLTAAADQQESRQLIDEIRDLLERAIDDTSTLTFELSPPILYELGVEAAIEWAGEQLCNEHNLEFEFSDDGHRKPLEEDAGPLLYRCARELMINVIKHAGASSLKVEIGRDGEMVRVEVEDDGRGFVPPEGGEGIRSSSFGLYSIQERIRYLGGAFDIESTPGGGTRARVSAPLHFSGRGEKAP